MKEVIRLYRFNESDGSVRIEADITGNRRVIDIYPTEADFLNATREWANYNPEAAGRLALLAYLAVDPTGSDNTLLEDVVTEIDSAALTIVRRVAV